ncbi:hypothetical protein D9M70_543340 [compost metagenome]
MHRRKQREAPRHEILRLLLEGMGEKLSKASIESAVDDLINHCNILKHSPESGSFGFGHLRYQEYLASEELTRNRAIDITMLTNNSWWGGALYLYSFNNSIQPIIDEIIYKYGSVVSHHKNLTQMIEAQPASLRTGLKNIIDRHLTLDRHEGLSDLGHQDSYEYIDRYEDDLSDLKIYRPDF